MPQVNGREFAFIDTTTFVSGRTLPLLGITAFEYQMKREHENILGAGKNPVSMWSGAEQPDACSITILQSELEAWQAAVAPGKSLTSLAPFNITIAYAQLESGALVVDRLIGCRIMSLPKGLSASGKNMEVKLDLKVFHIEYNI